MPRELRRHVTVLGTRDASSAKQTTSLMFYATGCFSVCPGLKVRLILSQGRESENYSVACLAALRFVQQHQKVHDWGSTTGAGWNRGLSREFQEIRQKNKRTKADSAPSVLVHGSEVWPFQVPKGRDPLTEA